MIIIVTLIIILKNTMSRMDNIAATLPHPEKTTQPAPGATDRRIDSKQLLGPEGRVIIEHDGQHYLLRQTHAGKLILTK
ncbi:MAG: hemin uptake protein HemP [Leclercia sp.]